MTTVHGIRLTPVRLSRWKMLAQQAGLNRNELIGRIIDNAELSGMEIKVSLVKNKSVDAVSQAAVNAFSDQSTNFCP